MYKLNIKPENCKYIVNEDKRKVVCLIENTSRVFERFVDSNFIIPVDVGYIFSSGPAKKLFDHSMMPNRFYGVATCAPEDNWDVETGKLIAYHRAKEKLNRSFFKRARFYVNTLDKWLDQAAQEFNALGDKLTIGAVNREERIKNLLGVSEDE